MAIGTTNFPTSLDTADELVRATNSASTKLTSGINSSDQTILVTSVALFPSSGIIRINDEIISYTGTSGGNTFTGCSRGFEGTTATSHQNNNDVTLDITAASNNVKNDAIIAIETKIGTGASTPTANTVMRGTGTGTSAFGQVGLTTDVTGTLPAANGGTGITSLGSGVATFLGTPSSANLASAVTDETGSGALVFGTQPALTLPSIGSTGFTIAGSSGGSTTIVTSATGSGTVTIPAGTATLATTANARAFKNLIINGDMAVSQRNGTTNTSTADDVYALDQWYALTQSAAIQVQQQSDQESGTPFNSRLTQNQATAQRMGYAQIIEGKNCKYLRGQTVTLSFRLRCSASQAIRYAILEWTGTEDSVTSDVVNSWTNTTYTTGNFFISTTTTIPTNGVTSITPSANTWTDATALTVTLGTSFNNLTVFVWTEGTAAQNVTLDVSRVQLEPGSTATAFEYLPIDVQLERCQRYYWRQTGPLAFSYMSAFAPASSTTAGTALVTFPVQMRRDPTVVETSNLYLTDLFGANFTFTATDINTTVPSNAGPRMLVLGLTGASGLTQGRMYALRCNNNAAGFLGVSAEL